MHSLYMFEIGITYLIILSILSRVIFLTDKEHIESDCVNLKDFIMKYHISLEQLFINGKRN